jgi:hypothetical protein
LIAQLSQQGQAYSVRYVSQRQELVLTGKPPLADTELSQQSASVGLDPLFRTRRVQVRVQRVYLSVRSTRSRLRGSLWIASSADSRFQPVWATRASVINLI